MVGRARGYWNRLAARIDGFRRPYAIRRLAFRIAERRGWHLVPTEFYYPIPDTRDLRTRYPTRSECRGIELRQDVQLRLLRELFPRFAPEYNAFAARPDDPTEFRLDNPGFTGIDPHVFHSMIRHFRPETVIEIGSGYSTLAGVHACRLNGPTRYVCIDPWPRRITAWALPGVEMLRRRVETTELALFERLKRNDVLFVDGSHVVRTGGDVCFVVLEVLPRLAPGVVVHFHDVFLPYDYPQNWVLDNHWFWTEQYLLQAYLAENREVEVLFGTHFMATNHPEEVRAAFPNALWHGGASFWIRKRTAD